MTTTSDKEGKMTADEKIAIYEKARQEGKSPAEAARAAGWRSVQSYYQAKKTRELRQGRATRVRGKRTPATPTPGVGGNEAVVAATTTSPVGGRIAELLEENQKLKDIVIKMMIEKQGQ